MSPPRGRAIHIPNQYDLFTRVPVDAGIYESPDYVLLASVVCGELVKIDDVKVTTVFRFSGDGDQSGGLRAPPLFGLLEDPGWSER